MTGYPRHARVIITFRSYWTSGTGEGSGRKADTRCHRDRRGLPALPMSQVKGTLRETAERLADAGVPEVSIERVRKLFGGRMRDGEIGEPDPAAISVSEDAVISESAAVRLKGVERHLFRQVASTSISEDGVALDRTLRSIEVAVPVVLFGQFTWCAAEPPDFDWITILDRICAATPAFGKGKPDGYGVASARVEPDTTADLTEGSCIKESLEVPDGAFLLELTLTPRRHSVFSGHSATEGAHSTLPAPTGAALLGWCAQTAGYHEMIDPVAVFHSGSVSFGDATPVGPELEDEIVPVPRSFIVEKGKEKVATANGALDPELVRSERPLIDGTATQFEAITPGLMSTRYALVTPRTGQRLRTGMADGRAATGQLFGLQHISGGQGAAFTAVISIGASVERADARRIVDAFAGRILHLGKGRNTGYGGVFACEARISSACDEYLPPDFHGPIRILAVSDVAAVNGFGAPAAIIDPAVYGLPDARFDPLSSAIRYRRFAPWNGALGCRDTERQVIEAGSVLAYVVPVPDRPRQVSRRQRVGAWQEAGLGAVWLAPPFLSHDGKLPVAPGSSNRASNRARQAGRSERSEIEHASLLPEEEALLEWMKNLTPMPQHEEG